MFKTIFKRCCLALHYDKKFFVFHAVKAQLNSDIATTRNTLTPQAIRRMGKKAKRPRNEMPHIAVLVDTSTGWGRRIIQGIINYAKVHGPWDIWIRPKGQSQELGVPKGWNGDGVIARVSSSRMVTELLDKRPVVNISGIVLKENPFPRVTSNVESCIQVAIEHFLNSGHRHFAYCSLEKGTHVSYHRSLFSDKVKELGEQCHVFQSRSSRKRGWQEEQDEIQAWLKELPKPIAIFTWATLSGVAVINACRDAGIVVPDEVSVLGGDYDDLLCEACQPALSGIVVPGQQIGHDAAQLLDRMMKGGRSRKKPILLEPTGIALRVSTDVVAVNDQDLVRAIRFIRNKAHLPIQVNDVVHDLAVSRRSLERRFKQLLGRTIWDEISRVHLDRAKMLLATTEMSIPQVAIASGYGSPEYFMAVFRKSLKTTPLKYRKKIRGGAVSVVS